MLTNTKHDAGLVEGAVLPQPHLTERTSRHRISYLELKRAATKPWAIQKSPTGELGILKLKAPEMAGVGVPDQSQASVDMFPVTPFGNLTRRKTLTRHKTLTQRGNPEDPFHSAPVTMSRRTKNILAEEKDQDQTWFHPWYAFSRLVTCCFPAILLRRCGKIQGEAVQQGMLVW